MDSLKHLLQYKIVSIIRGIQAYNVLAIAEALYEGGIRSMEITLNSPNALPVIENLVHKMGDKMLVGAGTVLQATNALDAINAGAKFILSPIVDNRVIQVTKQHGVVSIPGAFTATEIYQAFTCGADIIKIFPASIGPEYIKDLRGPFPQIPLMPTGGVHLNNIPGFLKAGAVAFGIGSALVKANENINEDYLKSLVTKAKQFVAVTSKEELVQ
jgi:2-dehydro-3-deoxyphosphogluconate aldolase/(4S)-4-hydroxy-2-oxoglutarate aldolase